jgi:hypothetical protein
VRITKEVRRIFWVAAALGVCSLSNRSPEFTNTLGWVTENIDPGFWARMGVAAPMTA